VSLSTLVSRTFLFDQLAIVKDYLYTDEFFRPIAIVTEDKGDISADLDKALQGILPGPTGKIGLCIFIQTCSGGGPIANTPAAYNLSAKTIFVVAEMPTINRGARGTLEYGLVVAETIVAVMKNFSSSEEPNCHYWDEGVVLSPPEIDLQSGLTLHVVTMHMHGGNVDATEVVATPVITNDGDGFISITCATVGAEIWFTIDCSRPTHLHGTAYAGGSVLVGSGVAVKARAYFTGMRASLIASLVIDEGGPAMSDGGSAALSDDMERAIG
jgi:hypothetical protein